jgi:prevent-host-death family protein
MMSVVPDIIPISELRQDAAGIIKRLKASKKPVFITQRGRASAVMVSVEDYERTQHEVEILKALAQGEPEIERGEGSDLETVFAKAAELLSSGTHP